MAEGFAYHANGDVNLLGDAGPGMTGKRKWRFWSPDQGGCGDAPDCGAPGGKRCYSGRASFPPLLAAGKDREKPGGGQGSLYLSMIFFTTGSIATEKADLSCGADDYLSLAEIGLAQIGDVDERHSARTEGRR